MPLQPPPERTYPTIDACYRDVQAHAKVELYCVNMQVKREGRHEFRCDKAGIFKETPRLDPSRRVPETKKTGCKWKATCNHDRKNNLWKFNVINPYHNHPPSESPAVHPKHRMEEREMQRPLIERGIARGDTTKAIYETVLAAYPGTITQFQDIGNMIQAIKKGKQPSGLTDPNASSIGFDSTAEMANAAAPEASPGPIQPIPVRPGGSRTRAAKPDLTWDEELRRAKKDLIQTIEISKALQDRVDFLEKERGGLEWRVGRMEAALFQIAGQAMANGAKNAQPPPSAAFQPPQGGLRWVGHNMATPGQTTRTTQALTKGQTAALERTQKYQEATAAREASQAAARLHFATSATFAPRSNAAAIPSTSAPIQVADEPEEDSDDDEDEDA